MKNFRNIVLTAAMVATVGMLRAAEMNVPGQRGEKWWGIYVGNTPPQPFSHPFTVTTGRIVAGGFTTPLLISSLGRYVWCPVDTEVNFDGAALRLSYDGVRPELVDAGRTLRDAYRAACHKYFPPDSTAAPAVEFYSTPLYDTSLEFGPLPSQQGVVAYAERLLREGFPKGIILIGDGWSETAGTYTFLAGAFPDPKGMVDRLHELGFKVMLTVTPYAALSGRIYSENLRRGFLLRDELGPTVVVGGDGGYLSVYDLSDSRQFDYVSGALERLKSDYGIDGLRFGDPQLPSSSLFASSLPAADSAAEHPAAQGADFMARWLALGQNMKLVEYCPGEGHPSTPYVNVIVGWGIPKSTQSSPALLSGLLPAAINTLVAGSLNGFNACRYLPCAPADTAALFSHQWLMARMLQLQIISPLPTVGFAPWRVTDKALYDAVKKCVDWRVSIAGYMADLYKECLHSGEPMVRQMEYMFPHDGFADCDDEFMLGSRYLCAPFFEGEGRRLVRLPRGQWLDCNGKKHRGPVVLTVKQGDGFAPIFELIPK